MAVITLTTDLGLKDYYVASVKGAILSELPSAQIIDITHEIPSFDLLKASLVIKNCYQNFPKGSIHIIGVNDEHETHLVVYANDHYFIGADNGMFSLIFDTQPEKIVEIKTNNVRNRLTFPTKDIFVKVACYLAKGGKIEGIGNSKQGISERTLFRAVSEGSAIKGMAIYIDHYGNIITNITKKLFDDFGKNRRFTILLRRAEYEISQISESYSSVPEGERMALFSSTGYIEIAMNRGNASQLFGIKQGDTIRVEFYD